MRLNWLAIVNLRNIESAEVSPGAAINWLVGDNGAGKTSVLEGIYMLARGNSFRISRVQPIIRRGAEAVLVHAQGTKDNGARYSVGLERRANACRARINGETVNRISDLARGLPLQIVGPNSYQILDRGPSFRRRLLDWGVFHVEHAYKNWYADYQRCLRQRNAALRAGDRNFWIWDRDLARTGDRISYWRRKYILRFTENFRQLTEELEFFSNTTFRYGQGWADGEELAECLERNRSSDVRRGYTKFGVQTADLEVLSGRQPAAEVLSRGEQKYLVVLIHLALGQTLAEYTGETPLILIDDLAAELDERRRSELVTLLRGAAWQCFVTTVSAPPSEFAERSDERMFHVEQGRIIS